MQFEVTKGFRLYGSMPRDSSPRTQNLVETYIRVAGILGSEEISQIKGLFCEPGKPIAALNFARRK
jgi:hypothetical protein